MPDVFFSELVLKMYRWVELPRISYFQHDGVIKNVDSVSNPGRGSKLGTLDRILRFLCVLKKVNHGFLECLFDQSQSTVSKDFFHCCFACLNALKDEYLQPLDPTSMECQEMIGKGAFKHFTDVIYAGDVTKV